MELDDLISAHATTLAIAPVVGAYLCLSAIGLIRSGEARRFLADLCEHPAAMHGVGAVAFFAGAGLLAIHHRHWSTLAEILINLVAIWWAFEGAGMLADPARMRAALSAQSAPVRFERGQWIALAAGIYLLAVGVLGQWAH